MVWRGVGAGDSKTKKDGQTGGGVFVANHVPLFPLFPAHPLPLDRNNFFTWILSLGANSKMGTIAGTRVLCTQYPARVTTFVLVLGSVLVLMLACVIVGLWFVRILCPVPNT